MKTPLSIQISACGIGGWPWNSLTLASSKTCSRTTIIVIDERSAVPFGSYHA